jgi:hypothetical protein
MGGIRSVAGPWVDQVERWRGLKQCYPEATYTADFGGNSYEGRLRRSDDWLPARNLEQLIDRLLARAGS